MLKVSGARIVISIPRLAIAGMFAGFVVVATQLHTSASNPQPIQIHTASTQQPVLSTPVAPVVANQVTPTVTTIATTTTAQPKPIVTTTAPQSVQPTQVVTPASSASVTNLAPTTPANSDTGTAPSATTTSYTSSNWSGYMATAGNYSSVTGSWTIPTATGVIGKTSADATWIGIGGVTTNDLIQVGTTNKVSVNGKETSTAFYELLPQGSRTITGLAVSPGDVITASLSETATNHWTVAITNTTTGKTYAVTVAYTSTLSSAEWVEEDPSNTASQLLPLDVFAPVAFTSGTTTTAGNSLTITGSNAQPITLISATKQPIAAPSALNTDGQSFTVSLVSGQ